MAKSPGTGGGSRGREARGRQYGNTRGKERQRRRSDLRELDPRYRDAMEETRKKREALDELIEKQRNEPVLGEVAGALYAAEAKAAQEVLEAAEAAEKVAQAEAEGLAATEAVKESLKETTRQFRQYLDPEPTESESGLPMRQPLWKFEKNFNPAKLVQEGDGNSRFAVTMAIEKLKLGYHVTAVLEEFGIGINDLPEGRFDELGWGIRPENKDEDAQGN